MAYRDSELSSREDLLRKGGLYPIPIPLEWKLIGAQGEDVAIPRVDDHPFHRMFARGAVLATEIRQGQPPELMVIRKHQLAEAPSLAIVDGYLKTVRDALAALSLTARSLTHQLTLCQQSPFLCLKVVVERAGPTDNRTEFRYLIRDQAHQDWEVTYLVRPDKLSAWERLFAEIEGGASSDA